MIDPKQTRGYLNNNPGNMDRGDPPWNGEIRDIAKCQNDIQRGELSHGRFCVFESAEMGIRAMAKTLLAYHDRLGCRSIRDYINRWAPPNENNTEAYKWLTLATNVVFYDDETAKRDETKGSPKTLVASMTPADINSGEKLVREFGTK